MASFSTAINKNILINFTSQSEGMSTTTKPCDNILLNFIKNKTLQKNLDDIYFNNSYHGLDENHKNDDIYRFNEESFDVQNSLHMNLLLLRAGLSGDVDVFNKCIEAKANVFFTDCGGRNILHHSVYSKSYSIVQILLENILKEETSLESDFINCRDRRGWTPLHIAVCRDEWRIAEYLLRFGANLLLPLSHNSSPCRDTPAHSHAIHFCAIRSNEDMLHVLLKYGADVQAKDSLGLIPLHYAAAKGKESFTKTLLLTAPQTLNVQDEFLRTPLYIAAMRGSDSLVSLFIKMGADLLKKDSMDIDCFYQAIISSHLNAALLIEKAMRKNYPDMNLLKATLPANQLELNDVEKKVCDLLLSSLKEDQVDIIARCVSRLGIHMCIKTLQQCLIVQENGGMRIGGKGRKKTAGGVFMTLLKEKVQAGTITLEDWSYIRAVYREKQRSRRSLCRRSNYAS